jgi:hypothetical protein
MRDRETDLNANAAQGQISAGREMTVGELLDRRIEKAERIAAG